MQQNNATPITSLLDYKKMIDWAVANRSEAITLLTNSTTGLLPLAAKSGITLAAGGLQEGALSSGGLRDKLLHGLDEIDDIIERWASAAAVTILGCTPPYPSKMPGLGGEILPILSLDARQSGPLKAALMTSLSGKSSATPLVAGVINAIAHELDKFAQQQPPDVAAGISAEFLRELAKTLPQPKRKN